MDEIAIVGIAALFPGSTSKEGFWRDIMAGRDLITDVPPSHWLIDDYYDPDPKARDKTYAKRGAFLKPIDFDPLAWGVPPSNLPATDAAQLLALTVAQQVLEDACGAKLGALNRDRVSVILGVTSAQQLLGTMVSRLQKPVWQKSLREQGLSEEQVAEACERIASHYVEWQESTFPGVLGNVVAGRIANRLDLGGTNCVTDAACASSFSALSMAVSELRLGQADMVIAGGADTMNDIFMYVCFSKTPALSPSGDCRPFSDKADGTMLGEGLGMFALKRLADAERDGDRIYALIKGIGSSSDGRAKSVYAPVAEGQAKAIRRAYAQAGYGPETVELVEAHGTGTKAGDAAEFEGLRTVFDESGRTGRGWCALGSVKSQVGHTKAAAGAAGLFKAVMALHHRVLPPTIKVDRPDPRLSIEASPFHLNTVARPWISSGEHPRRASVSSFGFGGSNFHVALEEYTGPSRAPRVRPEGVELLLISGASAQAVAACCKELVKALPGALELLAFESQLSFDAAQPVRLAVFADSEAQAVSRLNKAAELALAGAPVSMPGNVELAVSPAEGQVGFLFPGQGSQSLRMGFDVCANFEAARAAWTPDLAEVVFPPPAFDEAGVKAQQARLTSTEWAQPAIGAASLSYLRLLQDLGVRPAVVGGHSFGEVIALCAAGVLPEADAMRVAFRRGELMAKAARTPGAMVSVAAPIEEVRAALAAWNSKVVVANHNTPAQTVLAGAVEEIAEVERRFGDKSISTTRLQVATAFHSPIVAEARAPFREFLEEVKFNPPGLEVYSNAEAAPYPAGPAEMRELLARQLVSPVRFVEQIEAMYLRGVRTFVEVGPGSVLTGLVGHILKKRPHKALALGRRAGSFLEGLATLSVAGVPVSYERLWKDHARPADPRLTKKPGMSLKLSGAGYGKIYPPVEGAAVKKPIARASNGVPPAPEPPQQQQAAPISPPSYAPVAPATQMAFMAAFQETQRQTAEAHALYQKATTDAHLAFLRSADAALANLSRIMSGQPVAFELPQATPPAWQPPPQQPQAWQAPQPQQAWQPPAPQMQPAPAWQPAPQPAWQPQPVAARPPAPAPIAVKARSAEELEALMLDVLATSTGYPKEMLRPDLDLEKDLGVDSIKRVEILAAVRDQAPDLPEVPASEMASKRTLRQIAAVLLGKNDGGPSPNGHANGHEEPMRHAPSAIEPLNAAPARRTVHTLQAPAPGLATPGLFDGGSVVLTDDGGGVAAALAAKLNACGARATVVKEVPEDAQAVILLDGLRAPEEFIQIHQAAFRAARTVARRFAASGGTFISVQDTGGDFGLSGSPRAWLGGLAALVKTARWEWPLATVRALDVDRNAPDVAELICGELLEGGGDLEVGLHGGRCTLAAGDARPEAVELALTKESVIVVSGGGRGVTAACVLELAKQLRCRFLLLGRTPLLEEPAATRGQTGAALKRTLMQLASGETLTPAILGQRAANVVAVREIEATLAAIREAGGEARYEAADLCDAPAVAAAVARARAGWGSIDAVIHGAGVLADKLIQDKTDAQFERVFNTKVLGLQALLEATKADKLRALLLFSSVAARFGNLGQADYAMGNEVLNKVAALEQQRRGANCVVRALGWGPWDGGMVDDGLRARFAALGVSLIPLAAGARQLCAELKSRGAPEILLGGAPPEAPARALTRDLIVDSQRHSFLAGHRLKGAPVVPVALVAEWFARAASESAAGSVLSLSHLRVLRGIRLAGFDSGVPARFQLKTKPDAGGLDFELHGPGGAKHFSASGVLLDEMPAATVERSNGGLKPWDSAIYGRKGLFHGAPFQVIEGIEGVSDHRLQGTLRGTRWPGHWLIDPALLDGGLQLALLWTRHVLGGASLPTAIERLDARLGGPVRGTVRCVVEGRHAKGERAVSDLIFTGESGATILLVQGLEAHLLPQPQRGGSAWDADGV